MEIKHGPNHQPEYILADEMICQIYCHAHSTASSPIAYEDFSTGVSQMGIGSPGRPLSVMKVFCNLRKRPAKAKQN